jgi:hypothetical protein
MNARTYSRSNDKLEAQCQQYLIDDIRAFPYGIIKTLEAKEDVEITENEWNKGAEDGRHKRTNTEY